MRIVHYPWRVALDPDEALAELPTPAGACVSPELGAFLVGGDGDCQVKEIHGPTRQSGAGQMRYEGSFLSETAQFEYASVVHQFQACPPESECRRLHYSLTDLFIQLSDFLYGYRANNENHLVDLSITEMCQKLEKYLGSERDFAPESLVVRIARELPASLKNIVENPRVVLKREHQQVPLDRMQEMDVHAVQDYARRPGRTSAMKAGYRQRLMAVVREETADTYENRVVRSFIELSCRVARQYKEEMCTRCPMRKDCEKKDPLVACASERVRLVHAFSLSCKVLLDAATFRDVAHLAEPKTQPNYVLQQNPRYLRVWKFYQRLLRQEDVEGDVWMWKRRTWADAIRVFMMHFWNKRISKMTSFAVQTSEKPFMIREENSRGAWLCSDPFEDAAVFKVRDDYATVYLLNADDAAKMLGEDAEQVGLRRLNADFFWIVKSSENAFRTRIMTVWCFCPDESWDGDMRGMAFAACKETNKILSRCQKQYPDCDLSRALIAFPGESTKLVASQDKNYFLQMNLFNPAEVDKFFVKFEAWMERMINE